MPAIASDVLAEIKNRVLSLGGVGSIRILEVEPVEDVDHDDEPILELRLTLSDPVDGADTWPTAELITLYARVTEVTRGVETELPWLVVDVDAVTPDPPDDGQEDLDLARRLDAVGD